MQNDRYTLIVDHLENPKRKKYLTVDDYLIVKTEEGEVKTGKISGITDSTFRVGMSLIIPRQVTYFQLSAANNKLLYAAASIVIVTSGYLLFRAFYQNVGYGAVNSENNSNGKATLGLIGITSGGLLINEISKKYYSTKWRIRIRKL